MLTAGERQWLGDAEAAERIAIARGAALRGRKGRDAEGRPAMLTIGVTPQDDAILAQARADVAAVARGR